MNACQVCGELIPPKEDIHIEGWGHVHIESSETCMSEGEREFQRDCEKLDEVRNRFSRNGYGTPDDHVWLIDKLQYEWSMCPWWRHKK